MRIGNQTALAAGDPLEPYRFAVAHGFNAFEWFSDRSGERGFSFDQLCRAERAELRREGERHDMRFSVHAPWDADPCERGDDVALQRSIHFAADIGAGIVVVHMNPDVPLGRFVAALAAPARLAQAAGVRLALENTVCTTPGMFNTLFTEMDVPADVRAALGMCLDIGHANLCPETMHDYVGYLDRIDPRVPIIHVHVHENFGDQDSHLTLFTGPAAESDAGVRGVLRRLTERGFTGSLILEQWPEPPELLVHARDHLRALIAELPRAVRRVD
ncbi:MAG: sugar phosphate isomerase/epimerase family protein [Phycisphaeraceae bacterium]